MNAPAPVLNAAGPHEPAKAQMPPMQVLVVDDDPVYRETARMFLTMFGRKVTVAESGTAGLGLLTHARFDIMIVDMEMPDMTGLEVIKRVRADATHQAMPIIMVTSRDDAMAIDRAYELGASSFVVKPVNWTLLDHYLRFVRRAAENEQAARRAQSDAEALALVKDNLLSVLRHEMKTPLNAITGFTRLAAEARQTGDTTAVTAHLDEVSESGARLLASFSDMMRYSDLISNRHPIARETCSPDWIFDDAQDALAAEIKAAGITITRHDLSNGQTFSCDPALVTDAVIRLMRNALQHAGEVKTITLRADRQADAVILSICDDGEGMEAERIPGCLAPFAQGDMSLARPKQGLGLGLPIAHEIARIHGGTLIAASTPGRGMRVDLRLPLRDEDHARSDGH